MAETATAEVKAKTPRKPKAAKQPEMATVTVTVPKGCKRTHLRLDALDSYSRELANKTFITVNGMDLPCVGFKLMDRGTLQIEILGQFEIVEAK